LKSILICASMPIGTRLVSRISAFRKFLSVSEAPGKPGAFSIGEWAIQETR
jgi:hypothetical protein